MLTTALTKLLLVFLAPYIKEGPLLLCKDLFCVVIFAGTGEGVATSQEDICNIKGEVVQMARSHTWKV